MHNIVSIKKTFINRIVISTIARQENGEPVVFETIIFNLPDKIKITEEDRAFTIENSLEFHNEALKKISTMLVE